MENTKDLFEQFSKLPKEVQDVINEHSTEQSYPNCKIMLQKLRPLGYTFEYYLDAIPHSLRKI
jgi:hypothetical protein